MTPSRIRRRQAGHEREREDADIVVLPPRRDQRAGETCHEGRAQLEGERQLNGNLRIGHPDMIELLEGRLSRALWR